MNYSIKSQISNLSFRYELLIAEIETLLFDIIGQSDYESETHDIPAIKLTRPLFDYKELVVINDNLTWLDSNGHHYSLYSDASHTDIIDLLNAIAEQG
jgi:hypothetical protein